MTDKFKKFDTKKLQLSLLPIEALEEIAEVMQHGAEKYGRNNWMLCDDLSRYEDALLRHFYAHLKGEDTDPDSGLRHLAHAACNLMFIMELNRKGTCQDSSSHS